MTLNGAGTSTAAAINADFEASAKQLRDLNTIFSNTPGFATVQRPFDDVDSGDSGLKVQRDFILDYDLEVEAFAVDVYSRNGLTASGVVTASLHMLTEDSGGSFTELDAAPGVALSLTADATSGDRESARSATPVKLLRGQRYRFKVANSNATAVDLSVWVAGKTWRRR